MNMPLRLGRRRRCRTSRACVLPRGPPRGAPARPSPGAARRRPGPGT